MNEKILVVDDDPEVCKLLGFILEVSDYEVLLAANGHEGLKLADEHDPDLIIVDNHMPVMTGLTMLEEFRKVNKDTPVIFMTAFGSENVAIEAFRLGINNYIVKPFYLDEVKQSVEWALREVRLRREKESTEHNLLTAEAIRRTMVTLAHHINNQLTVIDAGFTLISESLEVNMVPREVVKLRQILKEGNDSVMNISAILRVLQEVSEADFQDYTDQIQMINIDDALKMELEMEGYLNGPIIMADLENQARV